MSRLALTVLALIAMLAAVDAVVAAAARYAPSWMRVEDPRRQFFSEEPNQGTTVVLIGDSVFYSAYVDREDQSLWRQLERCLGARVLPAALVGASPHDFLSIARRVAQHWPPGTTALVGLHPVRLFGPDVTQLPDVEGPDAQRFRRLGVGQPRQGAGWQGWLDAALTSTLENRSFILRNRGSIVWYLESRLKQAHRAGTAPQRDAVWTAGDEGAGLQRWRALEAALAGGGRSRQVPFSWVATIDRVLRERGVRPVFVLTPLNVDMVRRYGRPDVDSEAMVTASHGYLVDRLGREHFEFIDLFAGADSESFADAIHTNARGNAWMATAIAEWLRQRPQERR